MLYAFTDESYTEDRYLQGAYVVSETQLGELDRVVGETLNFAQRFGIAGGVELRGYSIMNSRHGWEPLLGKFYAKSEIYRFFLSRIAKVQGRFFVAELISPHKGIFATENLPRHLQTQRLLFSQLNKYSAEKREFIKIIADEITTGTFLTNDFEMKKGEYPRLMSYVHLPSVSNPGIQVLDLILYIYQRSHSGHHISGNSNNKSLELWEIVEHLLER
jgi:hypothetical protein